MRPSVKRKLEKFGRDFLEMLAETILEKAEEKLKQKQPKRARPRIEASDRDLELERLARLKRKLG